MNLYTEIYDFFNEARPRTLNKGVEDIKRGKVIFKSDGDDDEDEKTDNSDDRGRVKTKYFVTLRRVDPDIEMTSTNVSEWIYQILSEKDRREIDQLVKQVEEKKITEEDFKKNIEKYLWEEKEVELSAGRILSLIKTDPKYSNISFEDIEEGDYYKIKKEIKAGPGGYIITDKNAPDKYIEISVDDKKGKEEKRKNVSADRARRDFMFPKYGDGEGPPPEPKPGSVHKIIFNTVKYSSAPKKIYTIYRKLSAQDIKYIKTNKQKNVVVYVIPDTKEDHAEDVYYITIPKKVYDVRRGADMTYTIALSKKAVDDLTADQKSKLKLRLVPLEDIVKGISKTTPLGVQGVSDYLTASPNKYKDFRAKRTKTELSDDDDEKVKPLDFDLSILIPSDKKDSEPETSKDQETEPEEKDLEKRADSTEAGMDLAKAEIFLDTYGVRLYNRLLRTYTQRKTAIEDKDKKAQKEAETELGDTLRSFVDLVFKEPSDGFFGLETEKQRDLLINKVLQDRTTKDKKMGLYNIIKGNYDTMKTIKEAYVQEAALKLYVVKTKEGTPADKQFLNSKNAEINKDENGEEIPREYIIGLDEKQVKMMKTPDALKSGIKDVVPYVKPEKDEPEPEKGSEKKFNDSTKGEYKVKVTMAGKATERMLNPKEIMILVRKSPGSEDLSFEDVEEKKVYNFEKKVDPRLGANIKGSIELLSKKEVGKADKTKVLTTTRIDREKAEKKEKEKLDRETKKADKEKARDEREKERSTYKTIKWMGKYIKVPVDFTKDKFKIKMATPSESDLEFKYYLVDFSDKENYPNGRLIRNDKGGPLGTDDRNLAKSTASQIGGDVRVYQRPELKAKSVELKEALSKEDIAKLKSTRVSFTIQSALDPDKQYNISDNVREVKEEKDKIVLFLAEAGVVTFDKEGTGIFKYNKDNKEYQALNVPADLNSMVKKALAPAKEPEPKLEAYIRKRVRQAIKEAEVSQYWGYQGKDVKKKRLEEYLKRYEWGFQDSDNPYTHSNGSAIHAIVSKLVHELAAMGVDAIAIFNSYAPEGYQVSDLDQLDYASDSPLGSQLTQPYNPDSLTARGGRVAEEDGKVTSIAQNYMNQLNDKYGDKGIEDLAKGYNDKDRIIMGSESVKKVVQKAIQKAYGQDAAKAGPQLKKAFMSISDEDLKNNP